MKNNNEKLNCLAKSDPHGYADMNKPDTLERQLKTAFGKTKEDNCI